jgi:two-component system nitrogen regulation sensor histidine kinase GlnL
VALRRRSAALAAESPRRTGIRPAWADVLASIDDGVIVLDRGGRVTDLNPAAEQLTGVSAVQAIGTDIPSLFRTTPWLREMTQETLTGGAAHRRREGVLAARHRETTIGAACAPLVAEDGVVRGAVLVLHDLTLHRALDETTRRADRLAALGTVARGLAHEIRNPLGGIKGAAQLLRGALTDPGLVHCTDIIIREVERLDGLVEQLRELSVPPRLLVEPLNIHRVLNDVLALQRQSPAWGSVVLRAGFDPSLPAVDGDRAQLTQVFLNVVKNALEALGGAGELTVGTRIETRFHIRRGTSRGRFISVLVEDTGPGVPEDAQAELFSPFFTTKTTGTGLGLAVCHRIVTEHGGTIAYETRPTGGSSFRVTLPVSRTEEDAGGR